MRKKTNIILHQKAEEDRSAGAEERPAAEPGRGPSGS